MNTEEFLKQELNRRQFLGSSARNAAGMAAGMVGLSAVDAAAAAGDPVSVGVVGVRSRGRELASELATMPQARVRALCDIDQSVLSSAARELQDLQGTAPRQFHDFRQLLDDPAIGAVVIATPDHWHAPMTVLACQAGKHVYVEAPLSHSLTESREVLQAEEDSGKTVVCGLQQRSGSHFQAAIDVVRSGTIGRVSLARAWAMHRRKPLPPAAETASAPEGVDYNLWLGPAPARAFNRNRFHQHWRWFPEYGSGELGQWGVHMLDLARWGLGAGWPQRVSASSGRRVLKDARETPDTLQARFEYEHCTILWEQAQWSHHGLEGRSAGVAFYGENGTLIVDRGGWKVYDIRDTLAGASSPQTGPHLAQFLTAIQQGTAPAGLPGLEEARISTDLCHLAEISTRLERDVRFDPAAGTFPTDAAARKLMARTTRSDWQSADFA